MKNFQIQFTQVAYVQCDRETLDEMYNYSTTHSNEQACVTGSSLVDSEYKAEIDSHEIVELIDKVLEMASNCDIIFHL